MANVHKGEVGIDIGDEKYVLSYSADALAECEDAMGLCIDDINALLQDPKRVRIAHYRTMFFHALTDHHDDVDEVKAKSLFKRLSVAEAMKVILKAWGLAFKGLTELAEAKGGEGVANPPQPGAAESEPTGPVSSTPGASLAEAKTNSGG